MPRVSQVLHKAMARPGLSLYRIAKDIGMAYPTVHRFYHGVRELRLESVDVLADCLGLELVPTRKARSAKAKAWKR